MTTNTDTSSPHAIGAQLKTECDEILALSARLRAISDGNYDQLLDPAEGRLNSAIASISFIGQVKAGKTSLVNGLVGKPDFLPSDVNPWTAVVTRLFFGKPGGPYKGARFAFFDDEQWDKFANRGGRLGELAAEIPESDDKLAEVRAEVERMRERAKKQLGDKFQTLLGKRHRFEDATTEVLARYICAGDDPDALVTEHVQGRYADITREASVFFEKEKFAFPSVLVDTPGLNDPLLIREEITLQSLEHSQIFVLVLSAHQAFSSADLYLLRILNALRLDRLVVFVNRVDELTNPETDVPAIRKHITGFLEKENPGADISVLFGSAACANNAITGAAGVDASRVESMQAVSKGAKVPQSSTNFDTPNQQSAWQASGMPFLENALSEMILEGPGKTWTTSARIDLDNATKIISANAQASITELKKQLDPSGDHGDTPELDIEQFEAETERLFGALTHKLESSMNYAWSRIQKGLQERTEDFITQHDKEFAEYLERAKKSATDIPWSCDTSPLRRDLKHYLHEEFPAIQADVLQNIEKGVETISLSMVDAGISAAQGLRVNTADLASQSPSTTALSKVVAIDMEASWWKGWMSKFMRDTSISTKVAKMIRAQFLPIQNELMQGMNTQLVSSTHEAMTSYRNMLDSLTTLLAKDEGEVGLTSTKSIEDRIAALNERIDVCKDVSETLQQARAE